MLISKKKTKITVAKILEGTEAGRIQQVKYLQVIPVLSEEEDGQIQAPEFLREKEQNRDRGQYGNVENCMSFQADQPSLIEKLWNENQPSLPSKTLSAHTEKIDSAAIRKRVEPKTLKPLGHQELSLVPYSLKKDILPAKQEMNSNKTGTLCNEFDSRLGVNTCGHLEYYLDRCGSALDEFMAEFEPLPQQVGAVFLLGGKLIGIERVPNYKYWQNIREALIREFYGAWALAYTKTRGIAPPLPDRVALASTYSNLEALKNDYLVLRRREATYAKETIESLLDMSFEQKKEQQIRGYTLESLQKDQLLGQVVHKSDKVVYASLICQGEWPKKQEVRLAGQYNL